MLSLSVPFKVLKMRERERERAKEFPDLNQVGFGKIAHFCICFGPSEVHKKKKS
jgi:hypothetical protein